MAVVKSISSEMMSDLLSWRNPQGGERRWWNQPQNERVEYTFEHFAAVTLTEIALPFIITAAAVETIIYTALIPISALFIACDDGEAIRFFAEHWSSSVFTIFWAIADLFNNILPCTSQNLITDESFARYYISPYFLTRFWDRDTVERLESALRRAPRLLDAAPAVEGHLRANPGLAAMIHHVEPAPNRPLQNPPAPRRDASADPDQQLEEVLRLSMIEEQARQAAQAQNVPAPLVTAAALEKMSAGAQFIVADVLPSMTEGSRNLFKEQEAAIFHFFLTKAVFIYAFGKKAKEKVPDFFTSETQKAIENLRNEKPGNARVGEIEEALRCWDAALATAEDPNDADAYKISQESIQALFTSLKKAASTELQGNFLKACATEVMNALSLT